MGAGAFDGAQEAARYVAELTKELRNLSSLPLGQLGDELKNILKEAQGAVKELGNVKAAAETTEQAVARMNKELAKSDSHATALPGTVGLAPGELFTPDQLGKRVNPDLGGTQMAALLQDLIDRITKLMGPDNYIAKLLEVEIPYLKKGARSADEASSFLQNQLSAWMAGLMRELADPNTPPEMRKLLNELIRLAQTGQLFQRQLADKVDQVPRKISENVNAGFGELTRSVERALSTVTSKGR